MPQPLELPTDSAGLYAACSSVDPEAVAAGYATLWEYLYKVALHMLADQPEPEALAQDCAQLALIEVHAHLAECREPAAFRSWARRIAAHKAIDELRRRRRYVRLQENDEPELDESSAAATLATSGQPADAVVLDELRVDELRWLISRAPMSARSRRAVLGRYLDAIPDESLAHSESELAGQPVRPSHVQVARSKDIARLRSYDSLRAFLGLTN